jgi:group I intron endonuclease
MIKHVCGIYKITSITNKVYIGQSRNIANRKNTYRFIKSGCKKQTYLYRSLKKYGWEGHTFDVVYELPPDICQDDLDSLEQLFMDMYRNAGVELLNIRDGGSRGKHSDITREKQSKAKKGTKLPDYVKKKMSESHKGKGQPHLRTPEAIQKMANSKKGKPSWNKGKVCGLGETNNFYGKSHSEEFKKSLSESRKGSGNPMFGRKLSDEAKRKISERNKGKLKGRIPWNKGKNKAA